MHVTLLSNSVSCYLVHLPSTLSVMFDVALHLNIPGNLSLVHPLTSAF